MLMRKFNFKTSSVLGVTFQAAVRQVARMSYENTVTWGYIGPADVGEGSPYWLDAWIVRFQTLQLHVSN